MEILYIGFLGNKVNVFIIVFKYLANGKKDFLNNNKYKRQFKEIMFVYCRFIAKA